MSFCDDVTLACLTALRSRPWPPSSGELQLLLRAAELTGDSGDGSARAPARHAGPDRPEDEPAPVKAAGWPRVA